MVTPTVEGGDSDNSQTPDEDGTAVIKIHYASDAIKSKPNKKANKRNLTSNTVSGKVTVQIEEITDSSSGHDSPKEPSSTKQTVHATGSGGHPDGGNTARAAIPCMPTVSLSESPHRQKTAEWPLFNALVARILTQKEVEIDSLAQDALKAEFEQQRSLRVWDETKVVEWNKVCERVKREGKTAHVGRIFGIATIKNEELPDGHKDKKRKGRFVFQGSNVRDQDNQNAIFQELSSSPAGMEAAKIVDLFGLLPGHVIEQSDAVKAYLQAPFSALGGNTETWVRLPKKYWPSGWYKLRDPVCPSASRCMATQTQVDCGSAPATPSSPLAGSRRFRVGLACSTIRS